MPDRAGGRPDRARGGLVGLMGGQFGLCFVGPIGLRSAFVDGIAVKFVSNDLR